MGPIKVSDIKPTQLLLAWEPPVNDGGTPITSYVVSSKLAYQLYRSENRIGTTKETQYLVKDLQEGQRYLFYVYAQNEIGNSKALEIQVRTSVARGKLKWRH